MSDRDALAYLRKESGDIYNRLHSIEEDIHFVQHVRAAYPNYPIFPNLRCGAWYANPELVSFKDVPVYFKSTDGHFNNWSFNLRRANLHLLPVLEKHRGIILVDSTRSGKRMPDAFSKTVPIWCAVINRAVRMWDTTLYTPPGSVSVQEHYQIEKRIDGWVGSLVSSSFDIPRLEGPLRPFWITPGTSTYPTVEEGVIPVLCVSASRQVCEKGLGRSAGYTYIQGSGDDHELWGMGLDPNKFWRHREVLLEADRSRLVGLVERIVGEKGEERGIEPTAITRVGGLVSIASGSTEDVVGLYRGLGESKEKVYIFITSTTAQSSQEDNDGRPSQALHLSIPAGKRGQVGLVETVFPRAVEFIRSHVLFGGVLPGICCVCDSGNGFDRCVGVAVVLLQVFFDEEGMVPGRCHRATPTKETIQKRLEWVISSEPRANPTRTTLKRVNEYLMSAENTRDTGYEYTGVPE
ncbi:tRNA A64-2'-O-ribosylphosphate transferase [Amanita muscaria]